MSIDWSNLTDEQRQAIWRLAVVSSGTLLTAKDLVPRTVKGKQARENMTRVYDAVVDFVHETGASQDGTDKRTEV